MQIIDEGIAGGLKKYSTIFLLLIGALQTAWRMSPEVQAMLTPEALNTATGILAGLGFVGRFIKQAQAAVKEQDQ
jgi:hypothetical protein